MKTLKRLQVTSRGRASRRGAGYTVGLTFFAIMVAQSLPAVTIQSQVSVVTPGVNPVYNVTYTVSGFDFRDNSTVLDELDIEFPANTFAQLTSGVAPASFDLLLFQPNNPPGAAGDYSAAANTDHASLAGTFSVNFTLSIPAASFNPATLMQLYFINEFDNNPQSSTFGNLRDSISGTTVPVVSVGAAPEPSSLALIFAAGLSGCWGLRRRARRRPVRAHRN